MSFLDDLINFLLRLFGLRYVVLTQTLFDASDGTPIQGAVIQFYYGPSLSASWTSAGTSTTDSTGTATKKLALRRGQGYFFEGFFQGTEKYEALTDTTAQPLVV